MFVSRCSNLPAEICDIGEGSCSSDDHCGEVDKNDLSADDVTNGVKLMVV